MTKSITKKAGKAKTADRRSFIKGAALAGAGATVAAASSFPAPAVAQKRIEMTMVTTWPRDFPGLGTGAQRAAKRIEDLSEGRIKVQYFAAGERVGALDLAGVEGNPRIAKHFRLIMVDHSIVSF